MTLFQRARRPEQKAQRRRAILGAARALLDKKGFDATSMSAIACKARLSKGNLYRYYASKEQLFLALFQGELTAWIDAARAALAALPPEAGPGAVAGVLARTTAESPRMAAMVPLLSLVIERNVDRETLARFKGELMERLAPLTRDLRAALPGLDDEQIGTLLNLLHTLVAGLWPAANPPAALDALLEDPRFAHLRLHFRRDLQRALTALIRGLLAE